MSKKLSILIATIIVAQLFTVGCSNNKVTTSTQTNQENESSLNGNNSSVLPSGDEISLSESEKKANLPKTSKELLKDKLNKTKTSNNTKQTKEKLPDSKQFKPTDTKKDNSKAKTSTQSSKSSKSSTDKSLTERAVSNDIVPSHEETISEYRGLELEGSASKKDADYLLSIYNKLPQNLRTKFAKDGYKIRITSEDIAKKYYGDAKYGQILAYFSKADKKIYVINNSQKIYKSFLFEFGHYLDDLNGYISETKAFVSIYNKEREYLKTDIPNDNSFKNNSSAYFSAVFQQMYLNSTRTQRSCPKSTAFINSLIQKAK